MEYRQPAERTAAHEFQLAQLQRWSQDDPDRVAAAAAMFKELTRGRTMKAPTFQEFVRSFGDLDAMARNQAAAQPSNDDVAKQIARGGSSE